MDNSNYDEEQYSNNLNQERMIEGNMQDTNPEFVYNDSQLGQMILKVRSKLTYQDIVVKVVHPDGKVEYKRIRKPTKYRETLTEDLSSSFMSPMEKENAKTIHLLLSALKNFGDSYAVDMSPSYNFIADYSNSSAVITKGCEGVAPRVAKSTFMQADKTLRAFGPAKAKGWIDNLAGGMQ